MFFCIRAEQLYSFTWMVMMTMTIRRREREEAISHAYMYESTFRTTIQSHPHTIIISSCTAYIHTPQQQQRSICTILACEYLTDGCSMIFIFLPVFRLSFTSSHREPLFSPYFSSLFFKIQAIRQISITRQRFLAYKKS